MDSIGLLGLVGLLVAIPGTGASLAAFGPGELAPVTRLAAVFGLGYAAAGGCAFVLAAAHVFWLASFLPLWLVITAALWVLALRRFPLRDQGRAIWSQLCRDRLPVLLGAVVVLTMIILKLKFLHLVDGAAHYVYYLNGIEIANSHGVPAQTLEYGQSWAPATDKIFLDAFTGLIPLVSGNPLLGPGVLLLLAYAGAAVGLWAAAWELGLRRTGALLPLLLLANIKILDPSMASGFDVYRAEDFGIGVAFCALPLGIAALRDGGWRRAAIAGVVLAAAAGSHLIPVVIVVFALMSIGVAELLRGSLNRSRLVILRNFAAMGGISGIIYLAVRVFAGGTFGLGGASSQNSYSIVKTWFDPTQYLYTGSFRSRNPVERSHFFVPGKQVVDSIMRGATGVSWPNAGWAALLAGMLAVAVLLFFAARTELGTVGIAGLGTIGFILLLGVGFSFYYHVWIDATFGLRRMASYESFGLVLVGLGLAEGMLLIPDRIRRVRLPLDTMRAKLSMEEIRAKVAFQGSALAVAPVLALSAWVVPTSLPESPPPGAPKYELSQQNMSKVMVSFANWVRANTPCGARFLVNSRPEGAMTALTGRLDLSEGMGSFLRPDTLPYVLNLMLSTRSFYEYPWQHEAFLRQNHINYVVVSDVGYLIGYPGPTGWTNDASVSTAPFLHEVWSYGGVTVYQVKNAPVLPVSPLLQGPYLHCGTTKLSY